MVYIDKILFLSNKKLIFEIPQLKKIQPKHTYNAKFL